MSVCVCVNAFTKSFDFGLNWSDRHHTPPHHHSLSCVFYINCLNNPKNFWSYQKLKFGAPKRRNNEKWTFRLNKKSKKKLFHLPHCLTLWNETAYTSDPHRAWLCMAEFVNIFKLFIHSFSDSFVLVVSERSRKLIVELLAASYLTKKFDWLTFRRSSLFVAWNEGLGSIDTDGMTWWSRGNDSFKRFLVCEQKNQSCLINVWELR